MHIVESFDTILNMDYGEGGLIPWAMDRENRPWVRGLNHIIKNRAFCLNV